MKKYLSILIILVLFIGCAKEPKISNINHSKVLQLKQMLNSLHVNKFESDDLAKKAIYHSSELAYKYNLAEPPLFQNFLVNIGVRKRGLCWQFADDMLSFVKKQNYKSFDYYIGAANIGDYWSEHNVLVVTCKGCKFDDGIILDAWRNSGKLYFSKIKNDKKYTWQQRGGLR